MRGLALIAALLLLAFPIAGCGGGEEDDTAPENVTTTETGGGGGGGTTTEEGTTEAGTTTEAETTTGGEEGGQGDAAKGKQIFAAQGCGSCHTLSDAGASGTVGPNLDEAKPSADKVVEMVTNGGGVMPSFKDKLSQQEINDVAAYVSSAAGS
jgi:mono/diheme cytochrome c family protein